MRTTFLGLGAGALCLGFAFWNGGCAAGEADPADTSCTIGLEKCACTKGGACDPGLECLSGLCVDPTPTGSGGSGAAGSGNGGTSGTTTLSSGAGGQMDNCDVGCAAIDVLFALDHSGSMVEEIAAISATQAFTGVIDALSGINCGDIDYRVGVTDDNTPSFVNGSSKPWFDSTEMSKDEIVLAFNQAASNIGSQPSTPTGCEHVLTNATTLLANDTTGFLREDALLVVILLTDVDDYGWYDQNSACPGLGLCTATQVEAQTNFNNLVALKGGQPEAVASIVLAGTPGSGQMSMNGICNQPGACGCGIDCQVYDAIKLDQFATLLGTNGVFHNLCSGGAGVIPDTITNAFNNEIVLACEGLEPPK